MGIITGIVIGLLFVGLGVYSFILSKNRNKKKETLICACLAFAFFIVFLIVPFGFTQVKTGEVAVVKVWGEAKEIKTPGMFWRFWISTQVEKYDIKTQQIDIDTYAYSQDAQSMAVKMTVQFRVQPDKALLINEKYGNLSMLSQRLKSVAEERSKVVLSGKSAMKIIETRSTLSNDVELLLKQSTDQYYVDIIMVVLNNIDFSDAFESVVENKMIAEQEKLKAEFEKEKAIIKAEELLEVAKLKAEEELAKAEGEAKAQIEIATAQAESIRLKSLEVARMLGFEIEEIQEDDGNGNIKIISRIKTDGKTAEEIAVISEYLKYIEYLNKWNGKLPDVLVDDGSANILIPAPSN